MENKEDRDSQKDFMENLILKYMLLKKTPKSYRKLGDLGRISSHQYPLMEKSVQNLKICWYKI